MDDFTMRQITEKSEDGKMEATRVRTTAGFASISVCVGDQKILLSNEKGNDYQEQARALAEILLATVDNPCSLPPNKEGG